MTDKERLAELINECKWWTITEDIAAHLIANGIVSVIRCKDCRYSFEDDFDGSWWCCRSNNEAEVVEMHFCSYAEPKARDEE